MNHAASTTSFFVQPGWRLALPALVLTLAALLVLFRETAIGMVDIWARSGTYAHGFIVVPISLWLIWRIRDQVAAQTPKSSYLAVLLSVVAGFAWLLGEMATVNVVPQFALVFMLILAVVAVLGREVAGRITFPLLFLLFAVPFGDFTQPKLMEWTAKFTVLGLRLTGIPVYSEGQNLVIPSGSWSVVEACSGVRYLIASLTVGTLFAYLSYRSLRRRLIFVALSIVVPIVANWGRAYMIVMLGHLSGNTIAVGVDHLIYGWVFFGVVIMAMFWVGSRWREDEPLPPAPRSTAVPGVRTDPGVRKAALATVVLAAIWPLAEWQLDQKTEPPVSQMAPLAPIAGWQDTRQTLAFWQPRFENYAASTQAIFAKDGREVGLFIAYYRNQDRHRQMVTSMNVVVTTDDPVWTSVGSGRRDFEFNQQGLAVRTSQLRRGTGHRLFVWHWYWVDGRWTASDFVAKAYTVLSRLTGRGDDSAVIFVYTLSGNPGDADSVLDDFARAAAPAIESALRQTRETR